LGREVVVSRSQCSSDCVGIVQVEWRNKCSNINTGAKNCGNLALGLGHSVGLISLGELTKVFVLVAVVGNFHLEAVAISCINQILQKVRNDD